MVGDGAASEVAAGLLATLPGTPMVFAGDELGLTGVNGEDARRPMPWHATGPLGRRARWPAYRALLALRREQPALRHGGLRFAHADADAHRVLAGDGRPPGCWCWPGGRPDRRCHCPARPAG